MATGRIGVTPTLGTRWSKAPAGGTTSLSGLDDNSVSLVYSVGYEQVYRNGVLLSRGNDYTATTGNSITLIDATIAGDIIEVFANELVPLTDAISKGQFTAKGALLSATAASTPAVLTVGSNDQVLTADSSTSTGLKWATPAGSTISWSLLNTGGTALTGATTITISGISGRNRIKLLVNFGSAGANSVISLRLNTDSGTNYGFSTIYNDIGSTYGAANFGYNSGFSENKIELASQDNNAAGNWVAFAEITGCNSSGLKMVTFGGAGGNTGARQYTGMGFYSGTSTISSVSLISSSGNFDSGTLYVYASSN